MLEFQKRILDSHQQLYSLMNGHKKMTDEKSQLQEKLVDSETEDIIDCSYTNRGQSIELPVETDLKTDIVDFDPSIWSVEESPEPSTVDLTEEPYETNNLTQDESLFPSEMDVDLLPETPATEPEIKPRPGRNKLKVKQDRKSNGEEYEKSGVWRLKKGIKTPEEIQLDALMVESKIFVCKVCDLDAVTLNGLKEHVESFHSSSDYNICCDRTIYIGPEELYDHFRFHLDKDAFKCKECGSHLIDSKALKLHMDRYHSTKPPSHICEVCGKEFWSKVTHRKHMNDIHSEKEACQHCGKGKEILRTGIV